MPASNHITELIRKFQSHSLSHDELIKLRSAFANMSDREIEAAYSFLDEKECCSAVLRKEVEERIIANVTQQITPTKHGWLHYRWGIAAAASVGIVMISAIAWLYLRLQHYSQYEKVLSSVTEITTGAAERVGVTLPDGSTVILGPDSRLSYSLEDFNAAYRIVNGLGELQFSVIHNKNQPFTVISPGLEVKVLGTEFILKADTANTQAMLYLLNGSVEMSSILSGTSIRLKPKELVIMDRKTGAFTLCRPDNYNDATALIRGDLAFNNHPLKDVIEQLSSAYGIRLILADTKDMSKLFTGYIPSNNLTEALNILEQAFHFRADIANDSGEIILRKK